jgi:DNA repair exonuclease SbcCD ATPase subunit
MDTVQSQIRSFAAEYRHPEQERLDEISIDIRKRQEHPAQAPSQPKFNETAFKIVTFPYDSVRHMIVSNELEELLKTDWLKLLAELEQASQKAADRQQDICDIENAKIERGGEYRARLAAIDSKIVEKTTGQEAMRAQLAEIPNTDPDTLELELSLVRDTLKVNRESLSEARGRLAEIDRLIETIAEQEKQLAELAVRSDQILRDLADWKFLETACGIKSGIPVLKLDTMAPEIAGIAMDILRSYGRDWAIRFVTDRPSSDGKGMVETFDIEVTRSFGTDSIKKLCGGEKLIINHCLRQAITIYLRRNSGRDYRMVCYDESDGALSAETALVFLKAINRTHELSGAEHTFLITHREALWLQIPQRIHFRPEKGEIEIVHQQ